MLSVNEVKEIADHVLHEKLGAFGYMEVEVNEGRDHDDEDALFIVGRMRSGAKAVPGAVMSATLFELSSALLERADRRFPHLSLAREGDELPESGPAPWEH